MKKTIIFIMLIILALTLVCHAEETDVQQDVSTYTKSEPVTEEFDIRAYLTEKIPFR